MLRLLPLPCVCQMTPARLSPSPFSPSPLSPSPLSPSPLPLPEGEGLASPRPCLSGSELLLSPSPLPSPRGRGGCSHSSNFLKTTSGVFKTSSFLNLITVKPRETNDASL